MNNNLIIKIFKWNNLNRPSNAQPPNIPIRLIFHRKNLKLTIPMLVKNEQNLLYSRLLKTYTANWTSSPICTNQCSKPNSIEAVSSPKNKKSRRLQKTKWNWKYKSNCVRATTGEWVWSSVSDSARQETSLRVLWPTRWLFLTYTVILNSQLSPSRTCARLSGPSTSPICLKTRFSVRTSKPWIVVASLLPKD